MDEDSGPIGEKIEKYKEMVRRGKTIADLRSIKEEKEDRLKKVESDIKRKKKMLKYGERKRKDEKEIDRLEEKRYSVLWEILAIESIIGKEDSIGDREDKNESKVLGDDYKPLKYISAEEARKYGFDLTRLERIVRIERWLDKNKPGWVFDNIPSSAKRKLESSFGEVEKTTIEKDIAKIRDKKRKSKISEYLDSKYSGWDKEDPPSEAKDYLTNLLNISDRQFKNYLQDLLRERRHG